MKHEVANTPAAIMAKEMPGLVAQSADRAFLMSKILSIYSK